MKPTNCRHAVRALKASGKQIAYGLPMHFSGSHPQDVHIGRTLLAPEFAVLLTRLANGNLAR